MGPNSADDGCVDQPRDVQRSRVVRDDRGAAGEERREPRQGRRADDVDDADACERRAYPLVVVAAREQHSVAIRRQETRKLDVALERPASQRIVARRVARAAGCERDEPPRVERGQPLGDRRIERRPHAQAARSAAAVPSSTPVTSRTYSSP